MKKKLVFIFCIAFAAEGHAQVKKPIPKKVVTATAPLLKTTLDSFSYAMGVQGAAYYKAQGIAKMNTMLLKKGFDDGYASKTPLLTPEQCNIVIQQTLQANMAIKDKKTQQEMNQTKEEGKKFLAENKKRPGVIELPNGLQYEIIKQGTGEKPKLTDTVKAHYAGRLINGTEDFDNSYKRGEPLVMPVGRVIQGWVQALQIMPVGSKWKLFIPSDLGYGDRGAGDAIPGGATLIFDIELLEIVNRPQ